jgi:hypothetical protein
MGHVDKDKGNVVDERLWNSEDDEAANAEDDQTREKDNDGDLISIRFCSYTKIYLSIQTFYFCVEFYEKNAPLPKDQNHAREKELAAKFEDEIRSKRNEGNANNENESLSITDQEGEEVFHSDSTEKDGEEKHPGSSGKINSPLVEESHHIPPHLEEKEFELDENMELDKDQGVFFFQVIPLLFSFIVMSIFVVLIEVLS